MSAIIFDLVAIRLLPRVPIKLIVIFEVTHFQHQLKEWVGRCVSFVKILLDYHSMSMEHSCLLEADW
jgi:hypothetical protein